MKTAINIGNDMITTKKVRVMTEEESMVMISLIQMQQDLPPLDGEDKPPLAYQIADERLAFHNVPVERRVLLMIASLCDRPGTVVLYCAAVKAIAMKVLAGEGKPVTFSHFIEAFPMGFPTEEELHRIWEAQKVHDDQPGDNWIDRPAAWRG